MSPSRRRSGPWRNKKELSSGGTELEVPVGCPSEDVWYAYLGLSLHGEACCSRDAQPCLLLFDSESYEDLPVWVQINNLGVPLSKTT